QEAARLFGGDDGAPVLENPISADLSTMRPSLLPSLVQAAARNARRGFADCALFEIAPVYAGAEPADQRTAIAALVAPHAPRRWNKAPEEDLFALKGDLMSLLDELGAPVANLQIAQSDPRPWWRPGRAARLQLGPKAVLAEFGELHPRVLAALDAEGPMLAFEVWAEAIPEPKRKGAKTRPALALSPLMPLSRDFAFVVARETPAGDLVRAVLSADRALIAGARVFDVYEGPGVAEGRKSVAVEVTIQPKDKTLEDAEIEALSGRIVGAVAKAVGANLRS
ncbi:MAG: phenylalanine--tRNA ligase subunit beta, partial [Caulobacteraceae bacterium]